MVRGGRCPEETWTLTSHWTDCDGIRGRPVGGKSPKEVDWTGALRRARKQPKAPFYEDETVDE